jgi:hypothetical protein
MHTIISSSSIKFLLSSDEEIAPSPKIEEIKLFLKNPLFSPSSASDNVHTKICCIKPKDHQSTSTAGFG